MFFKKKNAIEAGTLAELGDGDNTRILALVAEDYLKEKRSKRRWGLLIKGLIAAYLLVVVWIAVKGRGDSGAINLKAPHAAVVKIGGVIGRDPDSSVDAVNGALRSAFKSNNAKGVIVKINSPGGTPVQSDQIYREIVRLREKYPNKKLVAVIGDVCASGGYYIASAADEIYANPASIVGSIGVRMGSFGFVGAMEKFGVERRLVTAGANKGMLDPFSPIDNDEVKHAEKMLTQVHNQFISAVKRGRGERLVETPDMFSGLFWSGEEAKTLGLIDEFGDSRHVAREIFDTEKLADYSIRDTYIERLSRKLGASFGAGVMASWMSEFNSVTMD